MATAASTYTWAAYEALLKAYLGIADTSEDTELEIWLEAAASDCDDFLGWYYTDENDDLQDHTPATHKPGVRLGIYEWVKEIRKYHKRTPGAGVAEVQTSVLKEKYLAATGVELARRVAGELWQPSVYNVSLMGG